MMEQDKSLSPKAGGTGSSSLSTSGRAAGEWGDVRLPGGVDYAAIRAAIDIQQVLQLLQWRPVQGRGAQLRGRCPIQPGENLHSTSFSVNLRKNAFNCFSCQRHGNQLDLFAAAVGLPLYQAALELCRRLGIEPPPEILPARTKDAAPER